jgi:hypothetical protein
VGASGRQCQSSVNASVKDCQSSVSASFLQVRVGASGCESSVGASLQWESVLGFGGREQVRARGSFQWPVRRKTVQAERCRADGRKSVGRWGGAISRRMQKKCETLDCTQAS